MKQLFYLFFFIFSINSFAQSFNLNPLNNKVDLATKAHLQHFSVLSLDPAELEKKIDAIPGNIKTITIRTPEKAWVLELFEYTLLLPDAVRHTGDPKNPTKLLPRKDFRTFKGNIKDKNSLVSLTLANGFFKLMVDDKENRYFIEPLNKESLSDHIAPSFQYLMYKSADVNPIEGIKCGSELVDQRLIELYRQMNGNTIQSRQAKCPLCVEVKVALAADITMFNKYGSIAATENQMLTILADVGTVFDDEFEHEYEYQVTGMWVSDDLSRDPWNMTRDINEQLTIFATNAGTIFNGIDFRIATNWTAKYTTGTIGLAYLAEVCAQQPFNVCSDYILAGGRQSNYLTLQAHEFGHNWSMIHDAPISNDIMAPVINGSASWSQLSVSYLNNYVNFQKLIESLCLTICPGSDAPIADFTSDITYGCQPVTVKFKDQSLNADQWEWKFPGGTPATSNLQNPTVVYRTPGLWEVTLKAKNYRCETEEVKIGYIEVNDVPVANFSFGQQGTEVFFIDQSLRADEYFWDFGDGEFSEDANPYHQYYTDSSYVVTLKVTNDCGTHTFKKTINIVSIPTAEFEADTLGGCAPKIIKFFDRSTPNVRRWVWEFPGGNPSLSFDVNPVVRYDNPGVYDVKLTVYASRFNHSLTKKLYITIDSLPAADFSHVINGNTVVFSSMSRYANTHFWDFGDGAFSTDSSPTHIYVEGRYNVMYISSNDCGSDTTFSQITIGEKPIAGFKVTNEDGCIPYVVKFQNTSTAAATSFKWYFPGGNPSTSTDKEPEVTYSSIGSFDVSLVASNPLLSDSIGLLGFINTNDKPTAEFTNVVSGFKIICSNQSLRAKNYFWNFGDNQISFEKEPTHDYGVEGEFNVRLVTENECGWDTMDKKVAVYLIPKVNYSADTLIGCSPLTVQFYDKSSIDVIEWDWQFENGVPSVSSLKDPKVVFNKPGRYTVKLTVKNTNGTNALTRVQYIRVLSTVLCPEFRVDEKTDVSTFITETPFDNEFDQRNVKTKFDPVIYPNPATGNVMLFLEANSSQPVEFELFDLKGTSILRKSFVKSPESISLRGVESGTYFVKLKSDQLFYVSKLIISN